jgi:hypothetical protein
MRQQRLDAYASALRSEFERSGLRQADVVRRAVAAGAGTLSETTFANQLKAIHGPKDPETVWALEVVLDCDGKLSAPLGLLPASQRTTPELIRRTRTAAEQAAEKGRRG